MGTSQCFRQNHIPSCQNVPLSEYSKRLRIGHGSGNFYPCCWYYGQSGERHLRGVGMVMSNIFRSLHQGQLRLID